MDDAKTLREGDRLDRYELLAPIASGGMASVWLAQLRGKRGFEKLFAIKTIKTDHIEDARFQQMFLDEARIASGIQHPNVAQILDLGERDDLLYIVMEWVDGDSLAHLRRLLVKEKRSIPLDVVLRVMADTCAGLHAAHELKDPRGQSLGVVHRDVSPHNIIVSSAGSVKVIDFGVAKAKNRLADETASGIIKGKIRYMAPEQVQGRAVDRRADLWALGVCLYLFVTGELPYDDDSDLDVVRRLMGDEPAPRPSGAVAEPIEEILAHSLVRDPDERFATAAAMQRALEAAIDELGLRATNDDVASYLRTTAPELEEKRREVVTRALDAARARDGASSASAPRVAPLVDDAALAPTMVQASNPARRVDAEARTAIVASTGGKSDTKVRKVAGKGKRPKKKRAYVDADESKPTLVGASLSPPRASRSGWVVPAAIAATLAATGAWFVWPTGPRMMSWMSAARVPEPAPPAPAAPPPVRPPPAAPATSLAPASSAAPPRAPVASSTPTASASAPASSAPAPSASAARDAGAAPAARPRKRPRPSTAEPAAPDDDDSPY